MAEESPSKSENCVPDALDKCVADGVIKGGSGLLLGTALSLIMFKRRKWPLFIGLGGGLGMAVANCQHSLSEFTAQQK